MTDTSFQDHLEFYDITALPNSAFKGVSNALDRRMDTALDSFYETVSSRENLRAHFTGSQSMGRAKSLQGQHWKAVFREGVDNRFYDRATKIGNVHARIGLEPKWYVGAYSLVLEHLIEEIVAPGWQKYLPWKRAQAQKLTALVKVSLLDIDLALSAYFRNYDEKTQSIVNALGDALEEVANGNLTANIEGFPKDYEKVQVDFNRSLGGLDETVGAVINGVAAMTTGSGEIRSASDDLARRTEEQAANLEETAAAIARTTENVEATAETTEKARTAIINATQVAEGGSMTVSEAVVAMERIEKSSEKINSIISVIDSIAFQTNLLALNAGVEAARAGETGKGFAVVAGEVRALAQRCTEAADEVKQLISESSRDVSSGVDLVNRTGEAFSSIAAGVAELSEAIGTIADSARDQADSLVQINSSVGDLDRSTQQNAAMAEQCNAAATSLAQEAQGLGTKIDNFQTSQASRHGSTHENYRTDLAA